jgi:hypothetical protein
MWSIRAIIISQASALYQNHAIKICKQLANGAIITLSASLIAQESQLNSLMFQYNKLGG